jgi:predicted CXXCH cytochrome family protein
MITAPEHQRLNFLKKSIFRPGRAIFLCVLAVLLVTLAAATWLAADWYISVPADAEATYVGVQRCAACHQAEHQLWLGSHHDRAMELATPDSVLGDFNDTEFARLGVTTRFFTRDGKYFANAEGPDGEHRDYQIKYTFGIDPLQQYMVEFPDGRVQVLRVSWDVHKKEWFEVPPPDARDERLAPGDPMHWTGLSQNWNYMCAECHSTNLQKNYDFASDTFHTTYSEIDVSCEACHGPGSIHVELAESLSPFWDRHRGYGLVKLKGAVATNQIETCASCHSRRDGTVHPDFRPGKRYLDHFELSPLLPGLYHANGQILDEVYVYGSFLQSKMHAKGIRCTDCHNPHSVRLKFEGNRLCTQCHQPGVYDAFSHHHHQPESTGAQCVSCHMPARTYMEIDSRRDHQFASPRPDLSVELGTPNACNDCHTKEDETPAWAAEQVAGWRTGRAALAGANDKPHFAYAFAAAEKRDANAEELLVDVVERRDLPAIVRATGATLLGAYDGRATASALRRAIEDPEPLVRLAGVRAFPVSDAGELWNRLSPLLSDPIRAVRAATASRLADFARMRLTKDERDSLTRALAEYRDSQEHSLERAGPHMNLGNLAERLGDAAQAEEHYRHAMRLEPYMAGPRTNLAVLLNSRMEERAATGAVANDLLVLQDEIKELRNDEVELLGRDARLQADAPFAWYRYGLMLYLVERLDEAATALARACALDPLSYDYRLALTLLHERQRDWPKAVQSAETLVELRPGDPQALGVLQQMRAGASRGN